MDTVTISTNKVKDFLVGNIENFAGFVNQVIHDEIFFRQQDNM